VLDSIVPTMGSPRVLALAHRGDWSGARENTLAAFAAAERAGADMIELDVRVTADGAVAVLHDPTLERVWGLPHAVAELTRAELGEIPELADALAAVQIPVMVDYTRADVVEPALEAIREARALDRVLFSGACIEGHRRIRELAPEARIALTWEEGLPPSDELLEELRVEYFNPPYQLVTPERVALMHDRGLLVSTWTVDSITEMERVLDAGVDAVISNRVGELLRVIASSDRDSAA
jgi:glycerophosphoryl diester phosphodiesterase